MVVDSTEKAQMAGAADSMAADHWPEADHSPEPEPDHSPEPEADHSPEPEPDHSPEAADHWPEAEAAHLLQEAAHPVQEAPVPADGLLHQRREVMSKQPTA